MIALALAISLTGWGCKRQASPAQQQSAKSAPAIEKCQKANQPFACILDAAMAADDPTLCVYAGEAKRMNCLNGYMEITGAPVACEVIQDPKFNAECTQSLGSITAAKPASASASSSTANPLKAQDGLKIDNR